MEEKDVRQWCMFMHLSQFAGYLVPFAGIVVPIVMWQTKKDEAPEIDAHGRAVVNAHQCPRSGAFMAMRRKAVRTVRANDALVRGVSLRATSTMLPRSSRKTID